MIFMRNRISAFSIILLIWATLGAQYLIGGNEVDTSHTSRYVPGRFSFTWSNDFLYKTDYYYSNGLSFSLDASFMSKSPFNVILLPHTNNSQLWHGITLTQDFFTPVDIYSEEIQYTDRPYASLLMVGNRKISQDRIRRIELSSEISIGILGRYSGGMYVQNGIHWLLWTSRPAGGWDNQIGTDLCINYLAGIRKELVNFDYVSFDMLVNARAGVPYTDFTPALEMKLGLFDDLYINRGMKDDSWQAYIHGRFSGRFVLYNATIQGGLLNNSNVYTININHFVYGLYTGLTICYDRYSLRLDYQWISPEIVGGLNHRWSSLGFEIAF